MIPSDEDCATCKFFLADFSNPRGASECHRHGPAVVPQPDGQAWTFWPTVGEAEWCGDYVDAAPADPEVEPPPSFCPSAENYKAKRYERECAPADQACAVCGAAAGAQCDILPF